MPQDFQASCLYEPAASSRLPLGYRNPKDFCCKRDWRNLLVAEEIITAQRAIDVGAIMKAVRWHWRKKMEQLSV